MIANTKTIAHRKQRSISTKLLVVILGAIIIAVTGLALTHHLALLHNSKASRASSSARQQTSKTFVANKPTPSDNVPPASSSQDKSAGSVAAILTAPTGTFVSNHHPNLSGQPAPNLITSTCATTTGATCQISFSKDGIIKSLPPETTDSTGSAYWDWKLQDYGLVAGTWTITATAKLGTQSQTTTDVQKLVVAQ